MTTNMNVWAGLGLGFLICAAGGLLWTIIENHLKNLKAKERLIEIPDPVPLKSAVFDEPSAPTEEVIRFGVLTRFADREGLTLTARDARHYAALLLEAAEYINPDPGNEDQLDSEVVFFYRSHEAMSTDNELMPIGWYAYDAEYPEEGVMQLDGVFTPPDVAAVAAAANEARNKALHEAAAINRKGMLFPEKVDMDVLNLLGAVLAARALEIEGLAGK